MKIKTIVAGMLLTCSTVMSSQNPIVQTCYTTDLAPMVHGDRLYVYTGHDEEKADFFWMQEWRVYSTTDMVNWTDHGSPFAIETFSWGDDRAWAPQCVERNGKFYFYVCLHSKLSGGMAIGVAVGDSPTGPFKDAIGKPLFENGSWDHIDPTVLVDDDGRAYIYWGNPRIYYAELNEDMVSLKTEVKVMEQTVESFGAPNPEQRVKEQKYKDIYVEGPWLSKRKGKYYLLYAAGGIPEHIAYSMSDSPLGPWTYKGEVMPLQDTKSFTNHCGVIDYKGNSYFFYHTGKLPGGGGFGRSVSVEQFRYNSDGTIPLITATDEGVSAVDVLVPYQRVEAETMAFSKGLRSEPGGNGGVYISDIHDGDYVKLRDVDFGKCAPEAWRISVASALRGGRIEVRLDSLGGRLITELVVPGTGGWERWRTLTADKVEIVLGVHDVYFVFKGRKGCKLFNLDWWEFVGKYVKSDGWRDLVGTGNPYLPLWEHLPDGEPRVFEDPDRPGKYRVYIIGSHDVRHSSYCGPDIRMWSAPVENLTDWRDEGPIFTYHVGGQWDVMYAPDLVEVRKRDGTKEYYLYPHSRGPWREAMVCRGSRPDGPFTPVNLNAEGTRTLQGSVLGFDPSVYVEHITDPADIDYATGFRAYGFWGFQRSLAAQLDPKTMYSVRPGTEVIPYFIPASHRYGEVRDPEGTEYPALYKEQKLSDFNFFEASSIRKVGNKYVMIFAGFSGPDYGLGSTNSTLRYAFGDSPLGPWRSGGVLVDSRGVVLNRDGSRLRGSNAAHNTHGSIEEINGQWYVFYHRPPRGFGGARQAMVAPITVEWDKKSVAEGGKVVITGYDPYAPDCKWMARASNGDSYTGAEVTSEGFHIFGLPPYKYYSAGYACYLSNVGAQQDTWDIWDNSMPVHMHRGDIVGYKYFGFGGLSKAAKGLLPFAGTKEGNDTHLNVFLRPVTDKAFKIAVWLDGPWDNDAWGGKKIGEIFVPAGSLKEVTKYTINVADAVDGLKGKHALFLVVEDGSEDRQCVLHGLGFSSKDKPIYYPAPPKVTFSVDGKLLEQPAEPIRSTNANGLCGYDHYEVRTSLPADAKLPTVVAWADNPAVRISVIQPKARTDKAVVRCDYRGVVKTYTVLFE